MEAGGTLRIPLQVSRGCVVASIQVDLSEDILKRFREDLLTLLHSSGASGVVLDVSGIEVMDHRDFEALRTTMSMARLMGAHSVLAGLRAGVVSSLVELEVEMEDVVAAMDLDDAFRIMEKLRTSSATDKDDDNARFDTTPADPL